MLEGRDVACKLRKDDLIEDITIVRLREGSTYVPQTIADEKVPAATMKTNQRAKAKPKKARKFSRPVGEPDRLPQEDQIRVVAELALQTRDHQH